MSAVILQGDVFDTLPTIEPGSVDCVVTSPPYWALRSYLPKGHALKPRELGSEKTPAEYVARMVDVFRLVRDTMADHATCWLNIGDTYSHARGDRTPSDKLGAKQATNRGTTPTHSARAKGLGEGNLCLIPWRLAIALQDDGWIVRSVVAWVKPSPMPQSMTGWQWRRCRVKVAEGVYKGRRDPRRGDIASSAHYPQLAQWSDCPGCEKCKPNDGLVLRRGTWRPTSSWEPILLLAKSPRYMCDGEAVKQPAARPGDIQTFGGQKGIDRIFEEDDPNNRNGHEQSGREVECGTTANLRDVWQTRLEDLSKEELIDLVRGRDDGSLPSVWRIAAQPLREKHFAAFPCALVEKCLRAGTSARGYCPACGSPWTRVVEEGDLIKLRPSAGNDPRSRGEDKFHSANGPSGFVGNNLIREAATTLGWRPSCQCPPHEPRPGRVLDPFAGSCRTGVEAMRLGLDFTGCELNPEYVEMGRRILRDESPLFAGV